MKNAGVPIELFFGECSIGEASTKCFSLQNDGLTDAHFTLQFLTAATECFEVKSNELLLKPEEKKSIDVSYLATHFSSPVCSSIKVTHAESGNELIVKLSATLPQKSLGISITGIDFGQCIPGSKVYAHSFEILNQGTA